MRPVLFNLGPLAVYSWGFFLDLAVAAGVVVAVIEGRRRGVSATEVLNLSLFATLAGLVGARFLYVLVEWPAYRADPAGAFSIFEGGLSLYGALLGGAAIVFWSARRRGRPFFMYLDLLAPGMALGSAIGRVGCTLRGCCYGHLTAGVFGGAWGGAWGLTTPLADGLRFPAQPLEAFLDLAIFATLLLPVFRRPRVHGLRFLVYLALYALVRLVTEFFREGEPLWGWLTVTQAFSLAVLGLSLAALVRLVRAGRLANDRPALASRTFRRL